MKLSQHYTRFYVYGALTVFIVSLVTSYFGFKLVVVKNIDFSLSEEKTELVYDFMKGNFQDKHGDLVDISLANSTKNQTDQYRTFSVYDKKTKDFVKFRELKTYFYKDKQLYVLTLKQHLKPHLDNIFSVFPYFLINFLFFVLSFYVFNSFFIKKTFFPFYQILGSLKKYDIEKGVYQPGINTSIYEFKELDTIASNLTHRVYNDYKVQKEFIENSSHEFKTPLAIINNQLDMLIQSENLTEKEMQNIELIYDSIKRLINLNKNLTFLFKIENQHFVDNHWVDINPLLERVVLANQELYMEKDITVTKYIGAELKFKINETLLDVLLNNIINNAFKYCLQGTKISIRITATSLEVTNVAEAEKIRNINLFNRFVTSGDMNSTGLGLSILKKICDLYKIELSCTAFEDLFSVYLAFPQTEHTEYS